MINEISVLQRIDLICHQIEEVFEILAEDEVQFPKVDIVINTIQDAFEESIILRQDLNKIYSMFDVP